jgi:hypothetical protein
MYKLPKIITNLILSTLLLLSIGVYSQEEKLYRARVLLDSKIPANIELARLCVDSLVLDSVTKDDFISWTLRSFIYFDIYKRTEKNKLNSDLRDTIVSSILKSNRLNPDETYAGNNKKLLQNIGAGYFNLAKKMLEDSVNEEKSLIAFNRFKEIYKILEPDINFKQKDIEYNLTIGSIFSEFFIKDNNNTKAQNTAKVALLKVIELDPSNESANINLGLMYYNQAVNLSKELDYGADFTQIDFIQENMIKLAKQSEQFIFKVYSKNNKNVRSVEALFYLYRMLLDEPKSDEFKKIAIELGVKFGDEAPAKDEKINEEKK